MENKDNEKLSIRNTSKMIPEIIQNKKAYNLLISNRAFSFRKQMVEKLDNKFYPPIGWKTWKCRFLYPQHNIPKKNIEEITEAMKDVLIWSLQEQIAYLSRQQMAIKQIINESLAIVDKYKNIQDN